jgi:hypothetical protein
MVRLRVGGIYITVGNKMVVVTGAPGYPGSGWWQCSDRRLRLVNGVCATRYPSLDLVREWDGKEKVPKCRPSRRMS